MRTRYIAGLLIGLSLVTSQAWGDGNEKEPWDTVSDALLPLSLGATGWTALSHDPYDRETGRRMADTMVITTGSVLLLKEAIHSSRPPPSGEEDGFPSGHTAYAFGLAEAVSAREPELRPWLYGYAGLVGWSRVELNRHSWDQVLAGAALGYAIGHQTGRGRWRLLGHRDDELAPEARRSEVRLEVTEGLMARWDVSF